MKLSIAQLRERQIVELAKMDKHPAESFDEDLEKARHMMNKFYRLCGLITSNLYHSNNSYYVEHFPETLKKDEDREERRRKTLEKDFIDNYGLIFVFYGYLPTITDKKGNSDRIYTYFYND